MTAQKRPISIPISEALLAEAKELKINVSRADETSLARAIAAKRTKIWLEENSEALQNSNDHVERNGLPLAKYSRF